MKRMKRLWVVVGLSLIGFLVSGCSSKSVMELRDAAVSAAAAFIGQQTTAILGSLFDTGTVP